MGLGSAGGNIWSKLKIRFSRENVVHNYYFSIKTIWNQPCLMLLLEHWGVFYWLGTSVASTKKKRFLWGGGDCHKCRKRQRMPSILNPLCQLVAQSGSWRGWGELKADPGIPKTEMVNPKTTPKVPVVIGILWRRGQGKPGWGGNGESCWRWQRGENSGRDKRVRGAPREGGIDPQWSEINPECSGEREFELW